MNYVFTIAENQLEELVDYYQEDETLVKDPYIYKVFATSKLRVTVYKTLKVMLQGEDALQDYQMWSDIFGFTADVGVTEATKAKGFAKPRYYQTAAVGSDEVGTGDYFGPVVVTAAYVKPTDISALEALGVRDSKKMTDETIQSIGADLIKNYEHVTLVLDNPKYNELIAQGYNLNKIKAYLHNHALAKCLKQISGKTEYIIVDQFCSKELYFEYVKDVPYVVKDITFLERAESEHLAVALASVISRYTFLEKMRALSESVKINLPFGAGPAVDIIGEIVAKKHGIETLNLLAKTHFKNHERILERCHK